MSDASSRAWRFYLDDMIGFLERVQIYTEGFDQSGFVTSGLNYDATLRNLELAGEAATHIPEEVRIAHPGVPWRQIIATRNRLIHGYLGVDKDGLQYPNPPNCLELVTDLDMYPEQLFVDPGNFPYTDLDCNHGSLRASHPHWQWDNKVSVLFRLTRVQYGQSIRVTNSFRCPINNTSAPSRATSMHPQGKAIDFNNRSNQSNWDIAIAASKFVSTERIFLYGATNSRTYETLAWLLQNNYSGTNIPDHFPKGYVRGHADVKEGFKPQ